MNSKYIIAAVTLALTLTACDSFLDIKPKGEVIVTTAKDYREMLTEAYSIVPEDRGLATFRTDDVNMDATLSSEDLSSFKDIWCWNDVAPDDGTSSFGWRSYYNVIYQANHTIDNRENITDGTTSEINQLVGEAYMLRAYMHFLLVNLYGEPYTAVSDPYQAKGVPIKLDNDPDLQLSRSSVGAVYDQVISDIDEAEKYLNVETWETGLNYRFTTLSVNALRSRVYLYMGRWQDALDAAEKVIAKKPDLSDVSTELPNVYNSVENIVALEQVMTATYNKAFKVNTNFFSLYNSNDLRRSTYFSRETRSNIYCAKGGGNTYTCSFRTGEMYLTAAEAAARLGDEDKAKSYLNAIIAKRYSSSYVSTRQAAVEAMTGETLLNEILLERRLDLAFEGHRWFDLRRTTREQITRTYGSETYTLEKDDSRYTLRIPSAATEANPLLAQ